MFADEIFLTALVEGDFYTGRFACMGLTEGEFFPVVSDFYLIYKDRNNADYDYDYPSARMEENDTTVEISDMQLEPDAGRNIWHFGRIAVSKYGVISEVSEDCLVTVDSDAYMILPCGNHPIGVSAVASKDGTVQLDWQYFSQGEDATPDGFKIYKDVAGTFSDIGNVDYTGGRNYTYTTSSLTHGTNYKFTVRSYKMGDELVANGTMEADSNWTTVSAADINVRSVEQVYAGMYSRKFHCTSAADGIKSDNFTTISGKRYKISVYVYPVGYTQIRIAMRRGDDTGFLFANNYTLTTDTWNLVEIDFTDTSAGGALAYLRLTSHLEIDETWYVDNASVKQYHETINDNVSEATADDTGPTALTSITVAVE